MSDGERSRFGTRTEVRRGWSTVLIVFGGLLALWGLVASAREGQMQLVVLVGAILIGAGLLLRPWGQRT